MIEQILERIAVAAEAMSSNLSLSAGPTKVELLTPDDTPLDAPDYEALAKANKREPLLTLCKEKGVVVPPRTNIKTIAKMLQEHDAKAENIATGGTEDDYDPFADGDDTPPPVITREQVKEALTAVHTAKGVADVKSILVNHGKVDKLKDLAEPHFQAVYDAALAAVK